jgi:hypothetical protein
VISITGTVWSAKEVEVATVARVMAAVTPSGVATGLAAELVDESGRAISRGVVYRMRTQGCCGDDEGEKRGSGSPPYVFQAFVPDVAPGAALRITDGEQEIWSRRAPDFAPKLGQLEATVGREQQLELRWSGETAAERAEAWVQWSADQGRSWRGLATGLTGNEARLELSGVADGEILVRVLVHDGFFTSVSEPARVTVAPRAPEVAILHPRDDQTLYAGRTLHLWAAATDAAGEPLPDEACRWSLDSREVGRGKEVWTEAPPAGEHDAVLTVRWSGGEVVRRVLFSTLGDQPQQPPKYSR